MNLCRSPRTVRWCVTLLLASATVVCCAGVAQADVTISGGKTKNMSCSGGVCSPTAPKANLNVSDLANLLASGDVKVIADSAALDIRFAAPLSWTSTSRLTLDSYHSITFEQALVVAGTGALTITTNDGGSGGDFSFTGGHIEFWDLKSSLVINGGKYKLVKRIAQLATAVTKNPSGFYALAKKYNARHDGTYSQAPISGFAGTFEGLGNQMSNFSLNLNLTGFGASAGLFDTSRGIIRNISLIHVNVRAASSANSEIMGALVGNNYGIVKGAAVTGKVVGRIGLPDRIGGLVGQNYSTVIDSHSSARLIDGAWTGGFVGYLLSQGTNATIIHCYATGNVSGSYSPGGLVGGGGNTTESIVNSFATGAVDNADQPDSMDGFVGGLVGSDIANITASYATGSVTAGTRGYAGGLVGAPGGNIDRSFSSGRVSASATGECDACGGLSGTGAKSITNSYSTSAVDPEICGSCGGLVGSNGGIISASYSTGLVDPTTGNFVGGLIGSDTSPSGSLSNLYWDLDTSGVSDPSHGAGNKSNDPGITGLSDPKLKSELPSGFDPQVWAQKKSINNGYPYLIADPPPKK